MKGWILFFLCVTASLFAQDEFSTTLKSSASDISLDDQITLTLTVTYPKGYKPLTPDINRLLWQQIAFMQPAFTLVSEQNDPPVEVTKGSFQQWFQYVLEPWQTGTHQLGFGVLRFTNDRGTEIHALPNTVAVTVTAPEQIVLQPAKAMIVTRAPQLELDALNQQHLTQDTLEQPARNRAIAEAHTFPWHYLVAYVALLTLGTAGGLLYWLSRRPKKIVVVPPKPEVVALSKINQLRKKTPQTAEERTIFFVELSNLIRTYLEELTGINAPEKTTPEFLLALTKNTQLQAEDRQLIADLLAQADMVKFAAQETTVERCQEALNVAKRIIQRGSYLEKSR